MQMDELWVFGTSRASINTCLCFTIILHPYLSLHPTVISLTRLSRYIPDSFYIKLLSLYLFSPVSQFSPPDHHPDTSTLLQSMQQPTIAELRVRTTSDALVIFHAVRHGLLPIVKRRLDAEERRSIRSGDVFVWEERGNAEASGVSSAKSSYVIPLL